MLPTKILDNDEDFRHTAVMESKRRRPTEAELAILRVLWEGKAQTVRAIQQVLNQSRPTGYTTVLKLMQIMTEKGLFASAWSLRASESQSGSSSCDSWKHVSSRFTGKRRQEF